jgi:hypothetical protein
MPNYQIKVVTDGIEQGELQFAKNRKAKWVLNDWGDLSFDCDVLDRSLFELNLIENSSEIRLYKDNVCKWNGALLSIDDNSSTLKKSLKITAKEIGYFLKDRYTTATYTNQQESFIAWDLINQTQINTLGLYNSNHTSFGITQGTLDTWQLRDRTYVNDEIAKSLKQLTEVINGGDFEITPTLTKSTLKVFSHYKQKGMQKDVKFDVDDGSISNVKRTIDNRNIANYIIGIGNGITSLATDSDLERVAKYKLRQFIYTNKDISVQSTLDEAVQGILAERQAPLITYDFTIDQNPQIGAYDVGDYIRFRASLESTGGRFEVDANQRIFEVALNIGDDNSEKVALKVGEFKPFKQNNIVDIMKSQANRVAILEK